MQQENTGEARGGRKREQEKQEVGLGGGRSLARKESRKELGGDVVKGKERREGSVRKPLQDLTQSTRRASLGAPQVIIILDKTLLILILFNLHVSSLSLIPSSWPHTLSPSHFTCPSPPPLASFPSPFQVRTQRLELSVGAKHPIARGPPLATPALLKTLQGPVKAPARKGPASSSRAMKWEETRAPVQKEGTAVSRALLRENVGVLQREKPRVLHRAGSSGNLARRQEARGQVTLDPGLSPISKSLSTLATLPAYFLPHTSLPYSLSSTQLDSPPTRPPRLPSSSSLSSLLAPPSRETSPPSYSLLPHPSSCVSILKTPGRRKPSTKHVDFMENIAEREFTRECDITDSNIRVI